MIGAVLPAWPYPRMCAHRGAGKLAPENTLTAMRVGHAHGYTMVEFDVKLAADNVAFLLHDATLERTTSGRGRADALLWRELSRLDAGGWHSAKYAGEMLPTFAAIARWARAHGIACNVEIKPTPGRERETGAAVALDAASLWRDAEIPPLLSSFSEDSLEAARDAVPALPRALLLDELPPDWLDRLARLECIALDANHLVLTDDIVVPIEGAGERVTFTVSSPLTVHGVSKAPARRAPEIGEHNDELLQELGFSSDEIAQFRTGGTIPHAAHDAEVLGGAR